jgi:hypothetical protein
VAVTKKRKRGNPNLVKGKRPLNKDGKPLHRPAGSPNVISRALKDALIFAAEHSYHSADGTLEAYMLHVANTRLDLFVPLLGRLSGIVIKSIPDLS